jgi:hypothetical protein
MSDKRGRDESTSAVVFDSAARPSTYREEYKLKPTTKFELAAGEELRYSTPAKLLLKSKECGCGNIYITTQRVSWIRDTTDESASASALAAGFDIRYNDILLHAVCRDASACAQPCIFAQIEPTARPDSDDEEMHDETAAEASPNTVAASRSPITDRDVATADELFIIPSTAADVDQLFSAMSACAELHPDEDDDEDMDGDGGANIMNLLSGAGEWFTANNAAASAADDIDAPDGTDASGHVDNNKQ